MGVDVGRILDTRLAKDRSDLIKVDIEVKDDTPINADTVAQIEMQGITGQGRIELSTPKMGGKPPETPEGEKYPVLKGRPSSLAEFLHDMPKLGEKMSHTLDAINEFTHGGTKTVKSIKELSDSLKANPAQILQGPSTGKGVEIPK